MSLPGGGVDALHAVRLLGFADVRAVAERTGASSSEVARTLRASQQRGWTQESEFFDVTGWSLTEHGRAENERRLAVEREAADPERRIVAAHRDFLPLNARLLRACTDWQLRPSAADAFATNDHTDEAWDARILSELTEISHALDGLISRLVEVLARFAGYDIRFAEALRRAHDGAFEWVAVMSVDSCHRVWFELHEDLIATLGLERGGEASTADHR